MAKQVKKQVKNFSSRKFKRKLPRGIVHIQSNFSNTIVTITNFKGNVISFSSAGNCGMKGSRKSTPFAAKLAGEAAAKTALDKGLKQVKVLVKGPGPGRESALRGIYETGLRLLVIRDITAIPHNGCRPPKKRRV